MQVRRDFLLEYPGSVYHLQNPKLHEIRPLYQTKPPRTLERSLVFIDRHLRPHLDVPSQWCGGRAKQGPHGSAR